MKIYMKDWNEDRNRLNTILRFQCRILILVNLNLKSLKIEKKQTVVRTDCIHIFSENGHHMLKRHVNHSATCRLLENFHKSSKNLETFIGNTRERVHTRTLIHSNDICQIWTSSVKRAEIMANEI